MDSFNPFANAWGDEQSSSSTGEALPKLGRATSDPTVDAWGAAGASPPALGAFPSSPPASSAAAHDDAPAWEPEPSTSALPWSPSEPVSRIADEPETWTDQQGQDADVDAESEGKAKPASPKWLAEDTDLPPLSSNALPSAGEKTSQGTASYDDWGETRLPPSKWEESLNEPPSWEPLKATVEPGEGWPGSLALDELSVDKKGEEDEYGTFAASDTQMTSSAWDDKPKVQPGGPDPSQFAPISVRDAYRAGLADDHPDIQNLARELGVPVRNLDEEALSQIPESSMTETVGTTQPNQGSRWSLFRKKATDTAQAAATQARVSTDAAVTQVKASTQAAVTAARSAAPRPSTSTSAASASPPGTPIPGTAKTEMQTQQTGGRWFGRFRKSTGNPNSDNTTEAAHRPASAPISPSVASAQASNTANLSIMDDFGQLESFSSRGLSEASGTSTAYDALDIIKGAEGTAEKKSSWSLFSRGVPMAVPVGGAGKGKHSAIGATGAVTHGYDGEADLDGIFEAFEKAPKAKSAFDGSLTSIANAAPELNGLEDPYVRLKITPGNTQAKKQPSDIDAFDPLAAFNAPPPKLAPPATVKSSIPSRPVAPLAPPPSFRPASSTPPPLLAPPPGSTASRRSPNTLLDDFGDSTTSPTLPSVPAVPQPVTQSHPVVIMPPTSGPVRMQAAEDDFGDFEAFTNGPKRASGPMKLAKPPSGAVPTQPLHSKDTDFFDLL